MHKILNQIFQINCQRAKAKSKKINNNNDKERRETEKKKDSNFVHKAGEGSDDFHFLSDTILQNGAV